LPLNAPPATPRLTCGPPNAKTLRARANLRRGQEPEGLGVERRHEVGELALGAAGLARAVPLVRQAVLRDERLRLAPTNPRTRARATKQTHKARGETKTRAQASNTKKDNLQRKKK
jgi:hypothetical protein